MLCAEWYTSVESRRLSTVELKSKAFWAVDAGTCSTLQGEKSGRGGLGGVVCASSPLLAQLRAIVWMLRAIVWMLRAI
eukprot:1103796-Prorocentrum_minimum.AAC.1